MNRLSKLTLGMAGLMMLGLASCSDEPDAPKNENITVSLKSLTFDADEIWTGWNKEGNLMADNFVFSHQWTEWQTSQGFVAARITDTGFYTPMYEHQFEVITGGGTEGEGTPYMIANWNSSELATTPFAERSCRILKSDGTEFAPEYVYVTNAAYSYYSMEKGDTYCRKFAKGDKFTLIAHGIKGETEVTVSFDLADCTTDDASAGIVKTWKRFDLSPLGTVEGIYFTMESTDVSQWGMNTPAYFAFDKFTVKK